MNKKGASTPPHQKFIYGVAIIVLIILLFQVLPRFNGLCNMDLAKSIGLSQSKPSGAIFIWYDAIQKDYLDPSFQYLFGNTFLSSMKTLIGYKGVCQSILSFQQHFIYAFAALLWIALGRFLVNMLLRLFRINKSYWSRVWERTYLSSIKFIGLLIIYPTLMQVAIVNRFIEIITFYHFTNWLIYSFILAIYVEWLPEIIKGVIYYREYQKAKRAIFQMKAGTTKIQTAGRAS
jgi:hypothetical protein